MGKSYQKEEKRLMGWFKRTFGFSESAKTEQAEHYLDNGRYAATRRT